MIKKRVVIVIATFTTFAICISAYFFIYMFTMIEEMQQSGYIFYYNGKIYDEIINWYPTGKINKKDRAWAGLSEEFSEAKEIKGNKKIELYDNDPNAIFFRQKSSWLSDEIFYHKRDDVLPKPYDNNVQIVLEVDEKPNINLEGKLLNEFKQFIKECLTNPQDVIKSEEVEVRHIVKAFYEDYPAYQKLGYIGMSGNKVIMRTITSSNEYVYFVLPDNISGQIKELINN